MLIKNEIEEQQKLAGRVKMRLGEIKCINRRRSSNLSQFIGALSRRIKHPQILIQKYIEITKTLNINLSKETIRTEFEIRFAELFKLRTKTNISFQIWIANGCTDFFCYSLGYRKKNNLRGFTHKGVVFEIDGGYHNTPLKQKKDQSRDELLLSLGILPIRIPDCDVKSSKVDEYFNQLSPLSTNDRRRLRQKVALITCLYHATEFEWSEILRTCFGLFLFESNTINQVEVNCGK